jgi:uncharacterized protein YndB with AHSA1/START domain
MTLRQTVTLPAPPAAVYAALTDSRRHAAFTGSPARLPKKAGGSMRAYGGYISGKVLGLFPGRGLLQTWRTTEWPEGYQDSRLEIRLAPAWEGTRLTMIHSAVPAAHAKGYAGGWRAFYWKPLVEAAREISRGRTRRRVGVWRQLESDADSTRRAVVSASPRAVLMAHA